MDEIKNETHKVPAPPPAAKRQGKIINKGYSISGASHIKKALKGFDGISGSPKEDIDFNNYTLRQRSRLAYMSMPLATSAINANRTNIVGIGLKLKSTIDAETLGLNPEQTAEWERKTENEFSIWAENKRACDATGVNDFYGIQQLIALSWQQSGDALVLRKYVKRTGLMPYGLRLHIIEADRCRTPMDSFFTNPYITTGKNKENGNMIYDGVEVDKSGMITAYHFASKYRYESSSEEVTWTRVPAFSEKTELPNVLHIMSSERPDQYRGVPYLAQVIEPLLQLNRYTNAEIMAAVIQSFYSAFIKTQAGTSEYPFNEVGEGDINPTEATSNAYEPSGEVSKSKNEYELGPGTVNIMEPGEDVTFASPTHPQTGFKEFTRAFAEQIGAALEVPADLLLKAFDSSYSASRGALLEAWKGFKMKREWLTNDFCRPAYEAWMTEAVALGRISAPGFLTDPRMRKAWLGSEWIGPSQGQLDPVKETNAAVHAINNGLSTREAESIRLNGSKFSTNVKRLIQENKQLREAGGWMSETDINKNNDGGNGNAE